jgi:hypothetical protein
MWIWKDLGAGILEGAERVAVDTSIILREQFEITGDVITHRPTGYSIAPDGTESMCQLGQRLPSGEVYQRDDVREMATRLLVAHLRKKVG